LRSGFAIIFVFWLWLWLEIPGGGGSMAISIIAVLQANIISSQHKALLRFAGCFAGAAAGLFVLALSIDSTLIIFIILFLFIFFFAYIWAGKPGAAYTGAQAALAFLVCVMSSDAPASSVSSGIERLTGIFCGISCLWIINNVFFPIDMPAYFRSAFDDVKYEILRRIKRAEDILSSGNSNIIPNPIDTENIAQLISQLKAFNEISAKEVADSQKTLALLDEISISSGKASELLLMREKYKIELSGHYREIFEILRSILLRGPDELKEKEDSFKNLEEELLKEAETHLAYDGKKYKEERQRVFISEVFLNKTELIREIFNLGRSDCYTPPLQQEQNA
jgi:uncharacterized membrane protein YgaE (UPF0421/DUF939 family)